MKDRIRQLMEAQHLTQQRFAEMIDISPASLSSIFNDRTKPTLNHVDAIRKSFPNINLGWLLYGDGEMFLTSGLQNRSDVPATSTFTTTEPVLEFDDTKAVLPQQSDVHHMPQSTASQSSYSSLKTEKPIVKIVDKPQRHISEIRIFFDDQTWETFVPKK